MDNQANPAYSNDEITKHHFNNLANGTAVRNEDGSISTVYTRQVDMLNKEGERVPTLIPSVYDRKIVNEEEAVARAVDSGLNYPTAPTHEKLREFDKKIHKNMKDISAKEAASILEQLKPKMNEGGMIKQMEMFEGGGLSDEGGTIDEASGNDVPVGSLKEEVRDDIPAQLSEGEFVLPADVVRYHGLDKIMRLRDEAKAGLSRMEDMGQMGNSEEAVLPDGMPFNVEDLEMGEDSVSNELEMNVGGLVPQQQPYGVVQPVAPQVTNTYTMPSAFTNSASQPIVSPVAPVAPVVPLPTTTTPSFLLPQQVATTQPAQYSFKELMPGTVRREELNAAGQTGTPTATPSTTTRTYTGGRGGTGSTATDLAGAAATAYTAYKVAPKVIAGAKSAYAALTGASKAIPGFLPKALDGSLAVKGVVTEKLGELAATKGLETAASKAAAKSFYANLPGAGANPLNIGGAQSIGYAAPTFVAAIALYSLFKGVFGMETGKKNLSTVKKETREKRIKEVIVPYKQMMSAISGGVPYEKLIASQQPPKTPWDDIQDDIRASGVGDLDYELDSAKTMFQNNPAFQKQNEEFLAQGDNAKWYNPDMSRTDYMGEIYENNAALKSLATASRNSFVEGTNLPTGAPNPVLVAQEQYTAHLKAGGEVNTFVPDFEPKEAVEKETTTETDGT